MAKFKSSSDALLWYLKVLLVTKNLPPRTHVCEPHFVTIHGVVDGLRRMGKIRIDHFNVLEHYARKGQAPEADGKEYKAHLLWTEVADMLKPSLESAGLIEEKKWWQT